MIFSVSPSTPLDGQIAPIATTHAHGNSSLTETGLSESQTSLTGGRSSKKKDGGSKGGRKGGRKSSGDREEGRRKNKGKKKGNKNKKKNKKGQKKQKQKKDQRGGDGVTHDDNRILDRNEEVPTHTTSGSDRGEDQLGPTTSALTPRGIDKSQTTTVSQLDNTPRKGI